MPELQGENRKNLVCKGPALHNKGIVLIGTNDLIKNVPLEATKQGLKKVVKNLCAQMEQLVLMTVPLIPRQAEKDTKHLESLRALNKCIESVAAEAINDLKLQPTPKVFVLETEDCFIEQDKIKNHLYESGKEREYSKGTVSTTAPESNARGIGCLGDWYTINCSGKGNLEKFHEPAAYFIIKNVCTVPKPSSVNGSMSYTAETLNLIKEILPNSSTKPDKVTKKRGQGRSLFPDSDAEEDVPMNSAESSVHISVNSSLSDKSISFPLRSSPRRCASPASSKEPQSQPVNRMSPRRSMPGSPTHQLQPTKKTFAAIERPPEEGEFVLTEFEKKGESVYYVGKVLS
ncbi:hypothetical protein ONE63_001676 [Megalurothrips usitatus]|uniref:Uncharacterized protein n=1 Tax=Megalurothrips usitatus TaxID=439358 RepID=A0AAV7X925_9NEOP|nr:hypothetical protein ONE63_001676 [Megalurothrips usitatus]